MNDEYNKKIEIMRKYGDKIKTNFHFHIKGSIPSKKIDNALKTFAQGMDRTTIIGFYDTTVFESGKEGYIFTSDKVYYKEQLEKPKKLWYDDIKKVELTGFVSKYRDEKNVLRFELYDGTSIEWSSIFMNKTPLLHFFEEMLMLINEKDLNDYTPKFDYQSKSFAGAVSAGVASETLDNVNKLAGEEKFHARQGHGFSAERANHLYDTLTGHDAKIVGDDNKINGADRMVDGIEIQSKYCASGSRCINECFADGGKGEFRYVSQNTGKPMQIEVPSDMYESAVEAMKVKIERGQVPGVTDPEEAKHIVRKGHFTYQQAKNIAKAGTVESLSYDAVNGMIIATSALGISAVISFAASVWGGDDIEVALKNATYTGLKVGGTAFLTTVIAGQLSKAGLNSALVSSTEAMTKMLGPKAYQALCNAFRSGSSIYGGAAIKSAAKVLRGNIITAGVTIVVLSSLDIADIFRGRISGKQLFKNLTNTATTTAGGGAGFLLGNIIAPGVGGFVGAAIGGAIANKATSAVMDNFIEDDAEKMVRIFEDEFSKLAEEYLLNRKEAEKSVDRLKEKLDGKMLKEMFSKSDRHKYARNILVPIIESQIAKRKKVMMPTIEQVNKSLIEILEELADEMGLVTT